jgi:hypothetical protein
MKPARSILFKGGNFKMDFNFKKLADVEALTEVPENANALVEVDGVIKRAPGAGLGGGGGIKTAIIKCDYYDEALSGGAMESSASDDCPYSCINMTFEEAYQTMAAGEPLTAVIMEVDGDAFCYNTRVTYTGDFGFGIPCLVIDGGSFFWTSDGISFEPPGNSGPQ